MKPTQDARSLTQDQQELLRQKAVAMVLSGEKQVVVAHLLEVHKDSVSLWVRKARVGGVKALAKGKRGNLKKPSKLTKPQQATICRLITDKHPEQLKLPFALWTREAVGELIFRRFAIRVAIRTLGTYLRKWGFTPQKPARAAIEQQPQAVQRWLEQDYPALAARAKAENALIYWGDEMGLRSDHQAGRSFSPKGKTPVARVTGKRFGCNMISALTNLGSLAFSLFEGSFTVAVFLAFLARLIRHARGRKVFLVVDGHPVHRAKAVTQWLNEEEQVGKIELFFLPRYSPDRNPDELLNQHLKATVVEQGRPKDKQELKAKLRAKLLSIQKQPAAIRNYFKKPSVAYAAA